MKGKPKKSPREKDMTSRYVSGDLDDDRLDNVERFGDKSRHFQKRKTERTALMRAAEDSATAIDIDALPVGTVVTVHSLFCEVESGGRVLLCVVRRTLAKVAETFVIVGDLVRFRETDMVDEQGRPEAVIEQILPRRTILTRADSFKAIEAHPIVANADQMLIVAALAEPWPKWGLIDRMLIAAQAAGLMPIICLNKVDLADGGNAEQWEFAQSAISHYASMGVKTLFASVERKQGLDELRELLRNRVTVLAGHSGVGKSSLINAVQPQLHIRIGDISGYTGKGRHTTTSARRYCLDFGGHVIDTPGVKLFGLWKITADNVIDFFPDVNSETAPTWRQASYTRILESLAG